jgi:hypothetical protein
MYEKAKGDERYIKILQLNAKNSTVYLTVASLQLLGGVAGVYWASKKNYSFLGKVASFFGGAIIVGVPLGIATRGNIVARNIEIARIEAELAKEAQTK